MTGATLDPAPLAAATRHLAFLAECAPDGHGQIELRIRTPADVWSRKWPASIDDAASTAVRESAANDVYVGVALRTGPDGTSNGVESLGVAWVDCDDPAGVAALAAFAVPPSLVVESSPGKAHAYWRLSSPLTAEEGKRLNAALVRHLDREAEGFLDRPRAENEQLVDMRCAEPVRILRPAGTWNRKAAKNGEPTREPTPVMILPWDTGDAVDAATLLAALPAPSQEPEPAPVPKPQPDDDPVKAALKSIPAVEYAVKLAEREVVSRMMCCPFHNGGEESNPSLSLYGGDGTEWNCHACGEGGDIVLFAAKVWALDSHGDFPKVRSRLADMWGIRESPRGDALLLAPPERATAAELLPDVIAFLRRFLWLPQDDHYLAIGLWIMATHALDAFSVFPYLAITSPERECGKTQALEVLEALCARPWKIDGTPSEAVLFRKIEMVTPTLLLDEVDLLVKIGDQRFAPIASMLNAGYRRDATTSRCEGEGNHVRDFSVFCPKALAGINARTWPDTLRSRCIPIQLHRVPQAQRAQLDRWRPRRLTGDIDPLRSRLAAWGAAAQAELGEYEHPQVDDISPRAEDIWEPLWAVAAQAGCVDRAQAVAVALMTDDAGPESMGTLLLRRLRGVFGDRPSVATREILEAVNGDETLPFGGFHGGEGARARDVSNILGKYGVKPCTVRVGDSTPKGYRRDDLERAWALYDPLPLEPQQAQHPQHDTEPQRENPHGYRDVADVADVALFRGEGGGVADGAATCQCSRPLPRPADGEVRCASCEGVTTWGAAA